MKTYRVIVGFTVVLIQAADFRALLRRVHRRFGEDAYEALFQEVK